MKIQAQLINIWRNLLACVIMKCTKLTKSIRPQSKFSLPSRFMWENLIVIIAVNLFGRLISANWRRVSQSTPFKPLVIPSSLLGALGIILNHRRHTLVLRCMNHCLEFSGKTDMGFIPIIRILHRLRNHPHMLWNSDTWQKYVLIRINHLKGPRAMQLRLGRWKRTGENDGNRHSSICSPL